jgi:hypothetical protein
MIVLSLHSSELTALPEWQGHTETWCLVLHERRACLPPGFDIRRVTARSIRFETPPDKKEPIIFLDFEFFTADGAVGRIDLGNSFELVKTENVGHMEIGVYDAILNRKNDSRFVTVLGSIDHQFSMHAAGGTEAELLELVRNFATQWSDDKR